MKRIVGWLSITSLAMLGVLFSLASVHSQEAAKSGDGAHRALIKVETGKIVVEVALKGTIESEQTSELFLEAKSWAQPFIVKSAVAHGARVKKGDVLLEFDTVKIDQALVI